MDSYGFLEVLPQSCSNLTNLATQKRPNTEPQGVPEALETPVSYTHLTLPTILLV